MSSLPSTVELEYEIEVGSAINAITFAPNGKYLVSGGQEGVQVSRLGYGQGMATMEVKNVLCVAISKDGRCIAAGTSWGGVFVWDSGKTNKQVFSYRKDYNHAINGIDFSPDSTRLVAASDDCTATIWDVANRVQVLTLVHHTAVKAAKYSPQGDHIAITTFISIQIYDSTNGNLLVDMPTRATVWYDTGLTWYKDHLFVLADAKIKEIDPSTGLSVSEWPAPLADCSGIALPRHGAFIACSADHRVSILNTSTHSELGVIDQAQDIRSIAFSPDDHFIAIGGAGGRIAVKCLSAITDSIPISRLHPTFQEPEIQIDKIALESWKNDDLAHAEEALTSAIPMFWTQCHHILASRALVRARLRQWDAAVDDANESIKMKPSVIGYIAKSVALVGIGDKNSAYRACDIAHEHFHSSYVTFILLIKAIIVFRAGYHSDAISRVDDLIATVRFNSFLYVVQAYMHFITGKSHMESGNYKSAMQSFTSAQRKIRHYPPHSLSVVSLIFGWKFDKLDFMIQQGCCEATYRAGHTKDASSSLLGMMNTFHDTVHRNGAAVKWMSDFAHQCLCTSGAVLASPGHGNTQTNRALLDTAMPTSLLKEWVKLKLASNSWEEVLSDSVNFTCSRLTVYRAVCDHLNELNKILDAVGCFRQMRSESEVVATMDGEGEMWAANFKKRCAEELTRLGDGDMGAQLPHKAITQYTSALALDPPSKQDILARRSKAYVAIGLLGGALDDAHEVTKLDPLSPLGYERKHTALHAAGRYAEAIDAWEIMLSKIAESSDPNLRDRLRQYVRPRRVKAAIDGVIQDAVRDLPPVLIDTVSGRLCDKAKQAEAFRASPVFTELISSMTTHIDHTRIECEVTRYYHYAMFSHKWEDEEPLLEDVTNVSVYDLENLPTHYKLKMFCKIAREAGFRWAWSDTCCIDKTDHLVRQAAIVAMFKWYEASSLAIIFLRGVPSPSKRGDLMKSVWNRRAWTLQEYHASKVVRFYNEDWTLYRNIDIPNHKDSPEIISEMEEATGISSQALMALRPGSDDIREKLCLASQRETTLTEDVAYSLLGIFSMSLPVVYGEGDKALGRLLAQLLASSGDTSILAWTGQSGSFNSCIPAEIAVFKELPTTYIPPAIEGPRIESAVAGLRASSLNPASVAKFYDELLKLPVPLFAGKRMKLPCISFPLGRVSASRDRPGVFRAQTTALGVVEIQTREDLSKQVDLILVHPWIDFLLDRQPIGGTSEMIMEEDECRSPPSGSSSSTVPAMITQGSSLTRVARLVTRFGLPFGGRHVARPRYEPSLEPPLSVSQTDKEFQALRVLARLRQPFGALLFARTRQNVAEYRRIASESMVSVQVEEITPAMLSKLVDSIHVLDLL